jgi:hypothetical protein
MWQVYTRPTSASDFFKSEKSDLSEIIYILRKQEETVRLASLSIYFQCCQFVFFYFCHFWASISKGPRYSKSIFSVLKCEVLVTVSKVPLKNWKMWFLRFFANFKGPFFVFLDTFSENLKMQAVSSILLLPECAVKTDCYWGLTFLGFFEKCAVIIFICHILLVTFHKSTMLVVQNTNSMKNYKYKSEKKCVCTKRTRKLGWQL